MFKVEIDPGLCIVNCIQKLFVLCKIEKLLVCLVGRSCEDLFFCPSRINLSSIKNKLQILRNSLTYVLSSIGNDKAQKITSKKCSCCKPTS
jgi:hypothetical protein